ncbi:MULTISPECIES: diaminopimelate decarboxylase [unclassified Campylobacter]|uniref:diaminopimelate decarboxylase n=1 Tax=unclassified Campylobacter TaxID=2593542 RepID=UPI0022E9CA3A|nr:MULTISPECIES: diaminopimelate decarboxylase [unclassified Campylobacter]MDA3055384.1 diaminopimelate decarboxylase [Campylobacter sp. CN_NA1]MDA3064926.1 diaminopimelate decarboxylase [Campylobacter sp. CN_NE4]MDA3068250.1 diaminopimelate decarboxylase [Campylobacter sp. CN_NE3]MDA3082437.1 diaminopimelate decarboxylase [Campylobacter sp. CN_EL2]MDA3084072.1 diaminopimelate decarboxylase [Campylobacter sp. CN_NE1]
MNYNEIATKFGTPLYVYDFDAIEKNYLALKNSFNARKSLVCFAVKANSNLSVLKHLANLGSGFDCVSIGEVKRALAAGANSYKIVFSGVGKQDFELKEALENDILMINLESYAEMLRLESVAKELGKEARISIRVNPNVDAKTHPYISTGLNENKFGVSIDEAKKMYIYAKNSEFLNPVGIHFHIGSQLTDIAPIIEASGIVSKLLRELLALKIEIKFFDIGGGIGIKYQSEEEINLYDYAQGILANLSGLDVTIVCEPGRFLVGNAGIFLTKVLYEKKNNEKRFVVVDGAMNDLIRPSLYGAYHEISVVNSASSQNSPCDIVGPICESGDFLAKGVELPNLNSGDLLCVKSAGAYGFTMSSNYNSRGRAAEVAVQGGKARLIRKRESFEDLIALEKEYL